MDEGVKSTRGNLRAFARYYKPHMGLFLLDMLCALVVALVAGLGLFAFLSTGGRGGMSKFGRSLSEMTGGLFGKKPPRDE